MLYRITIKFSIGTGDVGILYSSTRLQNYTSAVSASSLSAIGWPPWHREGYVSTCCLYRGWSSSVRSYCSQYCGEVPWQKWAHHVGTPGLQSITVTANYLALNARCITLK